MSSKLHGLVWEGCAFTGMILSRVAVMARLADYSNDEGVSWPAVETIRRQIGAKSESTVKAAIAELEKNGWLTKEERKVGGRNESNIYRLNVEKLEAAAAAAREAYKPKRKINPVKNDPSNIDPSTVDPSNFDGSTVDKKHQVRGAMVGPDPSVLKPDPSDKRSSCPDASQPDPQTAEQDFLTRHPDAVVFSAKKRRWGSQEDLACAQWIWGRVVNLYEQAASDDGEITRPKEPNWTEWANDVRMMRMQDGRTHRQICEMFSRAQRDPFWIKNVRSPSKLREKWDELAIRLWRGSAQRCVNHISEPDTEIPPGFRG
ncbi:TPA: helix-turn-helix domain-containing protein [Escherichia coli]|nr:helix-turn-helix domain-containing protein [Escherichia coli]EFI3659032.1 helix-turn-helix domain-containing protein [Escherichia coli]EFJ2807353.1 helix-turn-helix domain-containing protein [Escherichia coli]EJD3141211.1 helix-turn-helix domain-containing protein [Escherichia coli]HAX3545853.1 helix-turn-helix domain-containing protein [Escherichia coli]